MLAVKSNKADSLSKVRNSMPLYVVKDPSEFFPSRKGPAVIVSRRKLRTPQKIIATRTNLSLICLHNVIERLKPVTQSVTNSLLARYVLPSMELWSTPANHLITGQSPVDHRVARYILSWVPKPPAAPIPLLLPMRSGPEKGEEFDAGQGVPFHL